MQRTAVVVEDETDIGDLIATVLQASGYRVHSVADGVTAVELIRDVAPDLITLDIGIPGIDGLEVARRIRAFSDAYIIFISALSEPADAERARLAGGDEYLGKPFRPRDLRARVSSIPSVRGAAGFSSAPDISGLRVDGSDGLGQQDR